MNRKFDPLRRLSQQLEATGTSLFEQTQYLYYLMLRRDADENKEYEPEWDLHSEIDSDNDAIADDHEAALQAQMLEFVKKYFPEELHK